MRSGYRRTAFCLAVLLLSLPLCAAAAEITFSVPSGTAGGISWSLDREGTLVVSGQGAIPDAEEKTFRGYAGEEIYYESPWYAYRSRIRSAVLEEGITSVGSYAFDGCMQLTQVTWPKTLREIGAAAFQRTGLSELVLPENVEVIGDQAFCGCRQLTYAALGSRLLVVGRYAFYQAEALRYLELPGTLERIGRGAFGGCAQVEQVVFHKRENVTEWAAVSFEDIFANPMAAGGRALLYDGDAKVSKLRFSAHDLPVSDYAFAGCRNEMTLEAADGYPGPVGKQAFAGCANLTEVLFPSGIEAVGEKAFFGCERLTDVHGLLLGAGSVGDEAFAGCVSLASVSLGGTYTVGRAVFRGCSALSSVRFEEGFTEIAEEMFADCGSLKEIVLPAGIARIGRDAFRDCASLVRLEIPDGLEGIASGAFHGCASLKEIVFTGQAPEIASGAFGVVQASVSFHDGDSWIGKQNNYGGFLTWYPVQGSSADSSIGWVMDDRNRLIFRGSGEITSTGSWYAHREAIREIILGEGITGFGYGLISAYLPQDGRITFHAGLRDPVSTGLQGVSPENLAGQFDFTVYENWFDGAHWSLTRDGLLSVGGNGAVPDFEDRDAPWHAVRASVRSVTIEPGVTAVGAGAFRGLHTGASVVLPETAERVGARAFADCPDLKWAVLPASVTEIGENAFPAGLETLYAPQGTFAAGWAAENGFFTYDSSLPDRVVALQDRVNLSVSGTLNLDTLFRAEPSFREAEHTITYRVTGNARVEEGLLIPQEEGEATVYALLDGEGQEAQAQVRIRREIEQISLPPEAAVTAGSAIPLDTVSWAPGDADPSIVWTVDDPSAARVEYGMLWTEPGVNEEITVTATAWNGVSAVMKVNIYVPQVSRVAFRPAEPVCPVGTSLQLVCDVTDQTGTRQNDQVVFSSDHPEIIRVDQEGNAVFLQSGAAVITARAENGTADQVSLRAAVPAESFGLSADRLLFTGDTLRPAVQKTVPAGAELLLTWESENEKTALVDETGLVTLLGPGQTTVTATSWNGVSASVVLTVHDPITEVLGELPDHMLRPGEQFDLRGGVRCETELYGEMVSYFSGNEKVAAVDQLGVVTVLGEGAASIVITAVNGMTKELTLEAFVPAESFTIDGPDALFIGQESELLALTDAVPQNAWLQPEWTVSDPKVASLSGNELRPRAAGEVIVRAVNWDGTQAEKRVQVFPAVTEITVRPVPEMLRVGQRVQLDAEVTCGRVSAGASFLTYQSSDEEVLTVDGSGMMYAVRSGDAVVTASAGGKEVSVEVRVRLEVESFDLPETMILLAYHQTELPLENLRPENAYARFDVVSDGPSVMIGPSDLLIGAEPGEASVSVTSWNGVTRTVRLIVLPFEAEDTLQVPSVMRSVGNYTFAGASFEAIHVQNGCQSIGEYAFADCARLLYVRFPESVRQIADTALSGCDALVCVLAPRDSYAARWAQERGIPVIAE